MLVCLTRMAKTVYANNVMKKFPRLLVTSLLTLVLFVAGGLLIVKNHPGQIITNAASTDTYSTDWTASQLLTMKRTGNGITPDNIALGVAGWKVSGSTASGTYFAENWTLPMTTFPIYNANGTMTNLDNASWLGGVMRATNINQYVFTFGITPVGTALGNTPGGSVRTPGITSSCGGTDSECVGASGAYGFTDWHSFATASDGKETAAGLLIPLKWHVDGKLCDSSCSF